MPWWQHLLLIGFVLASGGLATRFSEQREKVKLVLSFSGAYILGITVLHLLPDIFLDPQFRPGLWILAGFFLQLFLEQLSGGIEHGHIHARPEGGSRFAISIMIGLCLHAFLEGLPLGSYEHLHDHGTAAAEYDHDHGHLFWGILFHKIPAAFALSILLSLSGYGRKFIWGMLFVFAITSPMGALFGSSELVRSLAQPYILAIVVGSFLHISTTILFESDGRNHRISWKKLGVIVLGIGLALLTLL